MAAATASVPCVLHEDEHLLVVNKPAGINTHAPSPFSGEGLYDWLKHREPRWARLAIIHRLDKDTSGVMVFGKTPTANRSLTEQFAERRIAKKYLLLTTGSPPQKDFTARSRILRAGDRYLSSRQGDPAETHFNHCDVPAPVPNATCLLAQPVTGRTHQIRVHAAENGFAILGDDLYGGAPHSRLCLHAAEVRLKHPDTGKSISFEAQPDFASDVRLELRRALIDPLQTDAFRIIHGASDGRPDWYVDRLGNCLLSQGDTPLDEVHAAWLNSLRAELLKSGEVVQSVYHKVLDRQVRRSSTGDVSPQVVSGPEAGMCVIRENGVRFELGFAEGYSVGLFLDQRDNRRRLMTHHVAAGFDLEVGDRQPEVLNTFAYTCGFSVCAALGGARTTSLDLSKKYLEWGKRNFVHNGLDPNQHDFIYGDAFDWMRRLEKKGRRFDVIILDPPTFSQSREGGMFRVEKDYGRLIQRGLPLLNPGGVLLASTNAATWDAERFLKCIQDAVPASRRQVVQQRYFPQPPDFPVSRAEPAYLKSCWFRIN
jgi:23S rRNA (cytosine1962-C5)-methyltransferase